jgi:mannose/cellobiose epimerase-like protein (N-acyl-D-glucosamine 2-epimerase family)
MNTGETAGPAWRESAGHRRWLQGEQDRLVAFHSRNALEAPIGFDPLDAAGRPEREAPRELYATARLVHCFAIEHLLGRPGAALIALHGLRALTGALHDDTHGGWFTAVDPAGQPVDDTKATYAHAFVLLAGASATQAGLPGARVLLDEAAETIDRHLWQKAEGAALDGLRRDWQSLESGYRGQNANMHLTEAYLAAAEATGDEQYLRRAESIANLIVNTNARATHWRIPEHYDAEWHVLPRYNEDRPGDKFRPFGVTVGHWFEWARLILSMAALPGSDAAWAPEAAAGLFHRAVDDGWDDERGGLVYTTDFTGRSVNPDRMHWVIAEAVGAAHYLATLTGESEYETWYRRFWDEIEARVIDRDGGSWWHQRAADGSPKTDTWPGKPDLYHAWQATLYPRSSTSLGLAAAARAGRID